ncbi:TetR/AcrR family transcriptional regulator [Candidatus Korobacter versatilis]|uniref:TetR/AcrR family transcriptional regulator n=1 Tax=Candidatus Korobacter versatilis TaxID=658062 RepID=UPI0002D43D29|nr:TetR/AcrR family transcriptional regulator [Candidatus Koribacter versatilis]
MQARSAVTVDAILEAAIQVLVDAGKERLTTTQVAYHAGVSVGTLYQYFPNKSALLQAALRRHLESVSAEVLKVCEEYRSMGLLEMGAAVVDVYIDAKMRHVKESAALYAVSSDVDGMAIAKAAAARARRSLVELFVTAKEGLRKDPELIATSVSAAMNGFARALLESKSPEREVETLRGELLALVQAYLRTCVKSPITI